MEIAYLNDAADPFMLLITVLLYSFALRFASPWRDKIVEAIGNLFSIFHGLSVFFILALMLFTFGVIALVVRFFSSDAEMH